MEGGFTGCNYFNVERSTMTGILGTWITYMIISIQFDFCKEEHKTGQDTF